MAIRSLGHSVTVAVESTGNTRYFKNRIEQLGIAVVVVNTLKFKVVNESVKKTDRHDASTLAEFLEKDMLPVARLCSRQSEELRRLLKVRTALVQVVLGLVRNKRRTATYRIMERYDRLKRAKGSGRSIIATARALSEIIWYLLNRNEPFDEARMKNPEIRRKAMEMQAAAFDAA